jgi:hypothetical protein
MAVIMGIHCSYQIFYPLTPQPDDLVTVAKYNDGYKLQFSEFDYGLGEWIKHDRIYTEFNEAKEEYKKLIILALDEESEICAVKLFGCWFN